MKIAFICGSAEPGKDGVGDYTRRLASEFNRLGHQASIIALYDKDVSRIVNEQQHFDDKVLSVLRIPNEVSTAIRFKISQQYISSFDPEWISLQFVIFSFDNKGLPFRLAHNLNKIGSKRKWHIMFHELWVGMDSKSSNKHFYWGRLQRIIIILLLRKLKPLLLHTQTNLYQVQLQKLGFFVEQLSLFSNIPLQNTSERYPLKCESNGCTINHIKLVLFGSIYPGSPLKEFAKEIADIQKSLALNISLLFVGRCGNELVNWVKIWQGEDLKYQVLGEQSPETISMILTNASFGITTTPFALVDKSGAVAAMREHGLPVLCVARKWEPRNALNYTISKGIFEYKQRTLKEILLYNENICITNKVLDVSYKLVNSLLKLS